MSIRIFVVDKNTIYRKSLCLLIEEQSDMEIVGEIGNDITAFYQIQQLSPDIIILDNDILDLSSIDLIQQISTVLPHTKIIALQRWYDKVFASKLFEAGVSACLQKNIHSKNIKLAIYTVMTSSTYTGNRVAEYIQNNRIRT